MKLSDELIVDRMKYYEDNNARKLVFGAVGTMHIVVFATILRLVGK
jgi:hypothetical protein